MDGLRSPGKERPHGNQRPPAGRQEGLQLSYRLYVPDHFVSLNTGWSTVSLPFTAELVSTQDKGEITHFYSGSRTADDSDDGVKIGHEYWLREYKGIGTPPSGSPAGVLTATFNFPDATGATKTVGNTFLWDYYYYATAGHNHQDANTDTYQTYYQTSRTLTEYPLLAISQASPLLSATARCRQQLSMATPSCLTT